MRLIELASIVRSKNAGPLQVTIDLMFSDRERYGIAATSPALDAQSVAALYGVDPGSVRVIPFEAALAIKIVLDRPIVAGSPGDRDVFGAQQHAPLLKVEL